MTEQAKALHEDAEVPVKPEGCTFDDALVFAQHLGVTILIVNMEIYVNADVKHDAVTVLNSLHDREKTIFLVFSVDPLTQKGHFDAILKYPTYMNRRQWCEKCYKAHSDKSKRRYHSCELPRCRLCKCLQPDECDYVCPTVCPADCFKHCQDCNIKFYTPKCFQNHNENGQCKLRWQCSSPDSLLLMDRKYKEKHKCGYFICRYCNHEAERGTHHCYIQRKKVKPHDAKVIYLSFIGYVDESDNQHKVARISNQYADKDETKSFTSVDAFMRWFVVRHHAGFTVVSFRTGATLLHSINSWLALNSFCRTPIYRGNSLLSITVDAKKTSQCNMSFIDAYNFIPVPLRRLPTAYDLDRNTTIPQFPPKLIRCEADLKYRGKYPDIDAWNINRMAVDMKEADAMRRRWEDERDIALENKRQWDKSPPSPIVETFTRRVQVTSPHQPPPPPQPTFDDGDSDNDDDEHPLAFLRRKIHPIAKQGRVIPFMKLVHVWGEVKRRRDVKRLGLQQQDVVAWVTSHLGQSRDNRNGWGWKFHEIANHRCKRSPARMRRKKRI